MNGFVSLVVALLMVRMVGAAAGEGAAGAVIPVTPLVAVGANAEPSTREGQLQELDEVIVRSKRLAVVIEEAEDNFFKLYNQLNKDDEYDVSCPRLNLSADAGSRVNTRLCLPGFVATAIADYAVFQVQCEPKFAHFDANRDGRISRFEAMANQDLDNRFDALDEDGSDSLNEFKEFVAFERWALANLNCYRPPPPELVLMEGSKGWYEHMIKVTNANPQLRQLAAGLDGLHLERATVQGELARFEAKPGERAVLRDTGPRPR